MPDYPLPAKDSDHQTNRDMGIADLYSVIAKHAPGCMETVTLESLGGMSIAMDVSVFMNKNVKAVGPDYWFDKMANTYCSLREKGIHIVSVFDGPNPPEEKNEERARRRAECAKRNAKLAKCEILLVDLEERAADGSSLLDPDIEPLVTGIREAIGERSLAYSSKREPSFLRPVETDTFSDEMRTFIQDCRACINRQKVQNLPILPAYAIAVKELVSALGLPHFQADGEAEAFCVGLVAGGSVHAVLSEDSDVLPLGSPILLTKYDPSKGTVVSIRLEILLDELGMNMAEFVDLCILLSCDYNERVSGRLKEGSKPRNIGAEGALTLIREYRRIEKLEHLLVDPERLRYQRCRHLLTYPEVAAMSAIPRSVRKMDRNAIETMPGLQRKTKDRLFAAFGPRVLFI